MDGNATRSRVLRNFKKQWMLQLIALIGIAYIFVFNFLPMIGIVLAFNDYKPKTGLLGFFTSKWVGLRWFREIFTDPIFRPIFLNTVVMSVLKLLFSFPLPILFALAINEIHSTRTKRIMQTVSYLPHFISWVIVQGVLVSFLNSQNGVINQVLLRMGVAQEGIAFLSDPKYFYPLVVISDVWKEMGWWAIIFLAAITSIDQEQYEAAIVDGAGRLQRIWHITLPAIKPTIAIVLILSMGSLLGGGMGGSNFDQAYLLGNAANASRSEILQTYTLKMGLGIGRFSYATAIGLVQSLISVALVIISNFVAKRTLGEGLF